VSIEGSLDEGLFFDFLGVYNPPCRIFFALVYYLLQLIKTNAAKIKKIYQIAWTRKQIKGLLSIGKRQS